MHNEHQTYDLLVIGSGFAGMAAALFAANRGLNVALTGANGGIDFSTGLIDLMAVHPLDTGRCWDDPWAAREAVIKDIPNHPYARVSRENTAHAVDAFCNFLAEQGFPYLGNDTKNVRVLTPLGGTKITYRVAASVWEGVQAMERKAPTLIVDFDGLKGFSGRQIVENQKENWPALRSVTLGFPGSQGELYPQRMAWDLGIASQRRELVEQILPHAEKVEYIGFPAILGLNEPMQCLSHLQELTGKKIFEIPTLPPAIAGTRLNALFERGLGKKGVQSFAQKMVCGVDMTDPEEFIFHLGKTQPELTVGARTAILASGRFLGKGRYADRTHIRETVFDLPVTQPESRLQWHQKKFFDPKGHPINQCGLETDQWLRPLDASGNPAHPHLYAAGAILAHNDWMRMKCGAGVALATAFHAVENAVRDIKK